MVVGHSWLHCIGSLPGLPETQYSQLGPTFKDFPAFQNSATYWGPMVQTHEIVKDIYRHTRKKTLLTLLMKAVTTQLRIDSGSFVLPWIKHIGIY